MFIYFKDLDYWQALQKKDENLEAVKKLIGEDDMKHFWGSYNNNDKLHLDFVLWLDDKLGQSSAIKVEDKEVKIGNMSVAQFSQLPFAANNAEYKRIEEQLAGLEQDIEQLQQDINEYPDNIKFSERLSQKVMARDKLQQDVQRQQNALLSAAKRIAELRKQKASEKLAKAAEAFDYKPKPFWQMEKSLLLIVSHAFLISMPRQMIGQTVVPIIKRNMFNYYPNMPYFFMTMTS